MGQGDSARDFDPSESMENVGILCVFPIFHTARLGQKIRRSPQLPLCGVALSSDPKDLTVHVAVRSFCDLCSGQKLLFGALALTAPLALPLGELSAEQAD